MCLSFTNAKVKQSLRVFSFRNDAFLLCNRLSVCMFSVLISECVFGRNAFERKGEPCRNTRKGVGKAVGQYEKGRFAQMQPPFFLAVFRDRKPVGYVLHNRVFPK